MTRYIRIDEIGTFKGQEHMSFYPNPDGEDIQENGISCYELSDYEGLKNLVSYWEGFVMMCGNYTGLQITVFEGEFVQYGTDEEEIAECKETLLEVPCEGIMNKLAQARQLNIENGHGHEVGEEYQALLEKCYEDLVGKILG